MLPANQTEEYMEPAKGSPDNLKVTKLTAIEESSVPLESKKKKKRED